MENNISNNKASILWGSVDEIESLEQKELSTVFLKKYVEKIESLKKILNNESTYVLTLPVYHIKDNVYTVDDLYLSFDDIEYHLNSNRKILIYDIEININNINNVEHIRGTILNNDFSIYKNNK